MNHWKILAILFAFFSFGSIKEFIRILTSQDQDIAQNRSSLIPMATILTAGFIRDSHLMGLMLTSATF